MAKNGFMNDETFKTISKLADGENGQAIMDYGKDNFLMGGIATAAFVMTGYVIYRAGKLAVEVVKYLKS